MLERELRNTRERLQATIEELETANEELSSANEEWQSTNEELEASKEELQSLNEELETLNAELRRKVDDLNSLNSDLQNLLDSTQIATLFLDTVLRIRNFTPATTAIFPLRQGDIGRPITELTQRFVEQELDRDIQAVLRTLSLTERQVRTVDGTAQYLVRILPYRTVDNVIEGVVLSFVNVTTLKHAEAVARKAQAYAEQVVDTVSQALPILDTDLQVKSANRAFYETFTLPASE